MIGLLRGARAAVLTLGALVMAGCHTYVPVETPAPGDILRIKVPLLSAAANRNAAPQSVDIEGLVISFGDTLVLATETRREMGAFRELIQFDTVRIAPSGLTGMDLRLFSKSKSVGLGVALAGGAAFLAVSALGIEGGQAGGGPGTGPNPSGSVVVSSMIAAVWGLIGR